MNILEQLKYGRNTEIGYKVFNPDWQCRNLGANRKCYTE